MPHGALTLETIEALPVFDGGVLSDLRPDREEPRPGAHRGFHDCRQRRDGALSGEPGRTVAAPGAANAEELERIVALAQDWLVLTQLTHNDASAVGVVMALQFGPQLLLLPLTGFAADHFNQRKLLIATQATMGALALALGILTVTGFVQLWQVYVFAFLFGAAAAFDAPVRQTFVGELVGDADLPNAVALNSTSFNAARMIGPAVSGVVISAFGAGAAFLINGVSFIAVLVALSLLRASELHPKARADHTRGRFTGGFRYVWSRPDLMAILIMLFLIGPFGLNFPIFISTMAVLVFHSSARGYGVLSSILAVGTVAGALLGAGRDAPRFGWRCSAPVCSGSAARWPRSLRAIGSSPAPSS